MWKQQSMFGYSNQLKLIFSVIHNSTLLLGGIPRSLSGSCCTSLCSPRCFHFTNIESQATFELSELEHMFLPRRGFLSCHSNSWGRWKCARNCSSCFSTYWAKLWVRSFLVSISRENILRHVLAISDSPDIFISISFSSNGLAGQKLISG